jgi:hypothetical protein
MVITAAVKPLVLDQLASRREVRAVPDVALPCLEVELDARLRGHAETGVLRTAVAHLRLGHMVLDDLQLRPSRHLLMSDHGACSDEEKKDRARSPA